MLFDLNYPFSAKDEKELQSKIKYEKINFEPFNDITVKISQNTTNLLSRMLEM